MQDWDDIAIRAAGILARDAEKSTSTSPHCAASQTVRIIHHEQVDSCDDKALCFGNRLSFVAGDHRLKFATPNTDLHDVLRFYRPQRCAFVTYGLNSTRCGREIDEFPMVIRVNVGPALTESPLDVGSRTTLQIINWKVAKLFSMTPFENISNVLTEGGMKKLQKDRNAMIFLAFDAENKLYTQNKSVHHKTSAMSFTPLTLKTQG